ncbi:hypothetical protein RRG08_062348 [Elysia crispata]|uniref:Uncharacterized protein n=1 Tax=Elysia crispata TaxID=231223 RepID=A0AAE0YGJ4_9GAST|nr:hypothetical protein RRG08_062348 [Elysia crispata]
MLSCFTDFSRSEHIGLGETAPLAVFELVVFVPVIRFRNILHLGLVLEDQVLATVVQLHLDGAKGVSTLCRGLDPVFLPESHGTSTNSSGVEHAAVSQSILVLLRNSFRRLLRFWSHFTERCRDALFHEIPIDLCYSCKSNSTPTLDRSVYSRVLMFRVLMKDAVTLVGMFLTRPLVTRQSSCPRSQRLNSAAIFCFVGSSSPSLFL